MDVQRTLADYGRLFRWRGVQTPMIVGRVIPLSSVSALPIVVQTRDRRQGHSRWISSEGVQDRRQSGRWRSGRRLL